jgi:hypothetical protein|nr:MAG TPA_asm: hypothetical protein [Caudoviricetes sp.]
MAYTKLIDFDELSLYDDKLKTYIKGLLTGYVAAQTGKGLSTNDFTDELKSKLAGIADNAQVNVQSDWNATGGDAFIKNKPSIPDVSGKLDKTGDGSNVTAAFTQATTRANLATGESLTSIMGKLMKWYSDLSAAAWSGAYKDLTGTPTIPTNNSQLTNGAGYQTADNVKSTVESYKYQTASDVTSAINTALASYNSVSFEKVTSLPTTGTAGTIYLISNGGSGQNVYDEYFWTGTGFELFGSTAVDLTGYVKASDITLATNDDINGLFA